MLTPLKDPSDAWYLSENSKHGILIAHAGGGIGRSIYTNSKGAIQTSIADGIKVIEIDICFTSDGIPVLTHNFEPDNEISFSKIPTVQQFLNTQINEKYTPMTFSMLIEMVKNWNGYIFIDCKRGALDDFVSYVSSKMNKVDFTKYIIQVSSVNELKLVRKCGLFPWIHFNAPLLELEKLIPTLVRNQVHTVSVYNKDIRNGNALNTLNAANIRPFIYTINHTRRMNEVINWGGAGIFTDWLVREKICKINK